MINPLDVFGMRVVPLVGPDGEPLVPFAPASSPGAFSAHLESVLGEGFPAEAPPLPPGLVAPGGPPVPGAGPDFSPALPDPGIPTAPLPDRPGVVPVPSPNGRPPTPGESPMLARVVVPPGAEGPAGTPTVALKNPPAPDVLGGLSLALPMGEPSAGTQVADLDRAHQGGAFAWTSGTDLETESLPAGLRESHAQLRAAHSDAAPAPFLELPVALNGSGQADKRDREVAFEEPAHSMARARGGGEGDAPVANTGVVLPLITSWLERRDEAYLAERDRRSKRRQDEEEEEEADAPTEGAFHEIASAFASLFHGWPSKVTRGVWVATSWFLFGAFRLVRGAGRALLRWRTNKKPAA